MGIKILLKAIKLLMLVLFKAIIVMWENANIVFWSFLKSWLTVIESNTSCMALTPSNIQS